MQQQEGRLSARFVTVLTAPQRKALEGLRDYIPESVPQLVDPQCSECGWQQDHHVEGGLAGVDHGFMSGPPEDVPFFTEAFLYNLMGKEDARTILAVVRNVLRAFDVDETTIHKYI